MDFVGPLQVSKSKNRYVIVAVEYFSKYPCSKATIRNDAATVCKFLLDDVFANFGFPEKLVSDRGSHFYNRLVDSFTKTFHINHIFSSSYSSQTNGLTERMNGIIMNTLEKISHNDNQNCDNYLSYTLYTISCKKHSETGKSPFEVLYEENLNDHKNLIKRNLIERSKAISNNIKEQLIMV